MPEHLVPPVEPAGVSAQKPLHPAHQRRLRRFHHQMKMIGHQTIRMHLPAAALAGLAQCLNKPQPILIIPEDRLPSIAPIHHMVNRSRILHSELARHGRHRETLNHTCQS